MKNYSKHDFIIAYCYSFGASKSTAEKVYNAATPEYIAAIIDGWRQDARKAFFND